MEWRAQDKVVNGDGSMLDLGQRVLSKVGTIEEVARIVLEGHLGSDRVPVVANADQGKTFYAKGWLHGHPLLIMTFTSFSRSALDQVYVWFSAEAEAAWRYYVEKDKRFSPPRKIARVYETGDEESPYVILGTRIRRWNSSQDLPKKLVGATVSDPDGNAFLSKLGKRWKPITQPLVAETVKDARRPVPEAPPGSKYASAVLGEGQMIRLGRNGPTWIDAEGAVHLASLAGYPLGYPDEISHPVGGEGWCLLRNVLEGEENPELAEIRFNAGLQMADEISYLAFSSEIGQPELRHLYPDYRWGRGGRHGERLQDDGEVSFAREIFNGHPVITLRRSGFLEQAWLSSSAQASLIETMSRPKREDADEAEAPQFRKKQRKAIDKLSRALIRLHDEGLSLVLHQGRLKVTTNAEENEGGMTQILPEFPAIPVID